MARRTPFEEWVDENRDRLERHATTDYRSAPIARAFLKHVDGGGRRDG